MPSETFRSIARKSGKSVRDMERYWRRAEQSYEKQQAKARRGEREPIRDKHSYVMATTLRQAQRTGPHPHAPLGGKDKSKGKRKQEAQESFAARLDAILETYHAASQPT